MTHLLPVTEPTTDMRAKGIEPQAGVFTDKEDRETYIPATDADDKQWTMQYIPEAGTKRFAKVPNNCRVSSDASYGRNRLVGQFFPGRWSTLESFVSDSERHRALQFRAMHKERHNEEHLRNAGPCGPDRSRLGRLCGRSRRIHCR